MTRAELAARLSLVRPLAFFDIESTGKYPDRDRIVEITIVKLHPDGRETTFSSLVNPTIPIPAEAAAIHGITDMHVSACRSCETGRIGHDGDNHDFDPWPTFAQLAPTLARGLQDCDLAGFNIRRFDVPMLVAEFARAKVAFLLEGRRQIDPLVIYHKREPRDLAAAVRFFCGRELEGAHRADADVVATIDVLAGQLERYPDLPDNVIALHNACKDPNWIDDGGRIVWMSGVACIGFGTHAGKPLESMAAEPNTRDYLRWMLSKDFPEDTKEICRAALDGRFPVAPVVEEQTSATKAVA